MDEKRLKELHIIAEEFGRIAKKVNDSSQKRKIHSVEAMKYLNQCLEIGEILNRDVETISNTNREMSKQNNVVFNSCLILQSNINNQINIISEHQISNSIDKEIITVLNASIDSLKESLNKALITLKDIIDKDNKIILQDKLIITRKQFQRECIYQLKELTLRSLEDAENAIKGSSSNLERGLEMINKFKNVQKLIEDGKKEELQDLIQEANRGWNIASKVNRSSTSQLEFTERVNQFTEQLHQDSLDIKEMVSEKHESFKHNLENITILTVILSLEFRNYIKAKDHIDNVVVLENLPKDIRKNILNLIAYVNIACANIETLANLNYDMTDRIHLNADLESKSVELTNIELEHYKSIKDEVNAMTEATRYPIEGSNQNIENGKKLEDLLNKLVDNI